MLRGIDSQIAIQRLNDYTKDSSAALKRGELQHDFQAQLGRQITERQARQVASLSQKQNAPQVDKDGKNGGQQGQQQKKQPKKMTPRELAEEALLVSPQHQPLVTPKYDIEV